MPRDSKAIGVHFGFPESARQFRDRGFALLQQTEDGKITIDEQNTFTHRKRLAVHVTRNNLRTGSFYLRSHNDRTTDDIIQQITDARDTLFEEELFFEICREARSATNQGVTVRAQTVEALVGNDYKIVLDYSDNVFLQDESGSRVNDNTIAEFVGLSIQLLLTAAHERNLANRSKPPPPMTLKPRAIPEHAILRPVLARLRHLAEVDMLRNKCDALIRPLQKAGMSISMKRSESNDGMFTSLDTDAHASVLSDLLRPARACFEIGMATGRRLNVGIATLLGPPLFGTRFETSEVNFPFSRLPLSRHESNSVTSTLIRNVLTLDVVAYVEGLLSKAENKMNDKTKSQEWRISSPHNGELTLYEAGEAVRKLRFVVQQRGFVLKSTHLGRKSLEKDSTWSWSSDGLLETDVEGEKSPDTTLEMVLSKLANLD
jgi:mediator of RNA polymerase II transcription subunit 17